MKSVLAEPVDPGQGRQFELVGGPKRPVDLDALGRVEAHGGLGQGGVIAVTDGAACVTQWRKVDGLMPNCSVTLANTALRVAASRCRSTAIRIARSRSSSSVLP